MEEHICLYKLLNSCTIRLSVPGVDGYGTGFFVASGFILTCFHVVEDALKKGGSVGVYWPVKNQQLLAKIRYSRHDLDLALLKLEHPINHLCVYLSEEFAPEDKLYSYGYPDRHSAGDAATFSCEGWTANEDHRLPDQMKFKAGQVIPGLSGAPLLNERTGYVCGLVVETRDRDSDLGGRAIPTGTIFQELPWLRNQEQIHQKDRRWIDCLKAFEPGIIHLKQAQQALECGDYASAKLSLVKAVDTIQEDKQPLWAAKAKYLQALAQLNGRSPMSQKLPAMREAENFMNSALQVHRTASYFLILALFKCDFSNNGRPQLKAEANRLIYQAAQSTTWTSEDDENIELLSTCQPGLFKKYPHVIQQVRQLLLGD